jgi:hypothetical protein
MKIGIAVPKPSRFEARALFRFAADRIYRVESYEGELYFLRIGSQYDLDRGADCQGAPLLAVMILAAREALFRKHKIEELAARDVTRSPADLLITHPHNFKLSPAEIARATILPPQWFVSLFVRHFGRLVIERVDGASQEYRFERAHDVEVAIACLAPMLGERFENEVDVTAHAAEQYALPDRSGE